MNWMGLLPRTCMRVTVQGLQGGGEVGWQDVARGLLQ